MKEIGIYIHIPFCKSKCYYCDFVSFAQKEDKVQEYINALKLEIEKKSDENYNVKTIFIGGGTPSAISEKHIVDIIKTIKKNYKIDEKAEITIELNPNTADEKKLKAYKEAGINRLSIGLQSSNNNLLKKIGRIHTYEDYIETVKLAKKVGFTNINTDIIIGLPNQTIYDVEDTINNLLKLELTHISVYSLILEPKTVLMEMYNNKEITLIDDELERYMYWFAKRKLEENGYIHYEISNFAKKGFQSKHNLDCWTQKEYLGFGVAASSYENKVRYSNKRNLGEYIENIKNNQFEKNINIEEKQDKQTEMNEYIILGLRKMEGVSIKEFEKKFNQSPLELYRLKLYKLLNKELIVLTGDEKIQLTDKGLNVANIVWEEFI